MYNLDFITKLIDHISKLIYLIFFNQNWYLSTYDDVYISKMNPRTHFRRYGWREGRYAFKPLRYNKIKKNLSKPNIEKFLNRSSKLNKISFEEFIQKLKFKSFPRF